MSVTYTKNFIIVGKLLALSINITCKKNFSIKQQHFLQHCYHNEEFRTSHDFFPITFCTSAADYFALQAGYVWLTVKVPTKQPSMRLPCLRAFVFQNLDTA
jgi:hypothetical protein